MADRKADDFGGFFALGRALKARREAVEAGVKDPSRLESAPQEFEAELKKKKKK